MSLERFALKVLEQDHPLDASPDSPWAALGRVAGLSFLHTVAYPPDPSRLEQEPTPFEADISDSRRSLLRRGYARLPSPEALWGVDGAGTHARLCGRLGSACGVLRRLGWHLAWILLYDEPWLLARMYGPALRRLSYGRLDLIPDFVFFHVEPGARGWPPHRDRPSMPSLRGDPEPLPAYVTCWLALTPATPETGCIYVVPSDLDPLYDFGTASLPDATAPGVASSPDDDEQRGNQGKVQGTAAAGGGAVGRSAGGAVMADGGGGGALLGGSEYDGRDDVSVSDPQSVRALPAMAGEALLWSGRLLHWGGAADAEATDPRVSISFAASAPEFEPPALRGVDMTAAAAQLPTLRQRLVLILVQLAVHEHQEPLPPLLARILRWLEGGLGSAPAGGPSAPPPASPAEGLIGAHDGVEAFGGPDRQH